MDRAWTNVNCSSHFPLLLPQLEDLLRPSYVHHHIKAFLSPQYCKIDNTVASLIFTVVVSAHLPISFKNRLFFYAFRPFIHKQPLFNAPETETIFGTLVTVYVGRHVKQTSYLTQSCHSSISTCPGLLCFYQ